MSNDLFRQSKILRAHGSVERATKSLEKATVNYDKAKARFKKAQKALETLEPVAPNPTPNTATNIA